jgi:hypothetical protein
MMDQLPEILGERAVLARAMPVATVVARSQPDAIKR